MQDEISKLSNQLLQSSEKEKGPFQGRQYQTMENEIGLTEDTTTRTDEVKAVVTLRSGRELRTAVPELIKSAPVVAEPLQEEHTSALISEEESQEEECLDGTIVEEPCPQQPQEGLVENSESSDIGVVVCLWEKKDTIPLLLTEEAVEEHKDNIFPLPPTDSVYILPLPAPQSQPKNNPLLVPPTPDQVYILPMPAPQPKPAAPSPKAKSNPLHVVQNFKELVASVHALSTTSKTMATAYIAWHSGWFGCGFGFGTLGPRHF